MTLNYFNGMTAHSSHSIPDKTVILTLQGISCDLEYLDGPGLKGNVEKVARLIPHTKELGAAIWVYRDKEHPWLFKTEPSEWFPFSTSWTKLEILHTEADKALTYQAKRRTNAA